MSPDFQLVLQFVVGLSFLAAAFGKIQARALFFDGLRDYRMLPSWAVPHAGVLLIAVEGLIAFSYLSGWLQQSVGILTLALLGSFLVVTLVALKRGTSIKCLCFGASDTEPLSERTLIRIALLGIVVIVLLAQSAKQTPLLGARYSAGTTLLALTCAVLVQVLASWALATADILRLIKGCRGCGRQAVKS